MGLEIFNEIIEKKKSLKWCFKAIFVDLKRFRFNWTEFVNQWKM